MEPARIDLLAGKGVECLRFEGVDVWPEDAKEARIDDFFPLRPDTVKLSGLVLRIDGHNVPPKSLPNEYWTRANRGPRAGQSKTEYVGAA